MNMDLSPQTWRILGLSVGLGYVGLGTFGITAPAAASQLFGIHPESPGNTPFSSSTTRPQSSGQATPESKAHAAAVETSLILLGARDLSIGIALLLFDQLRMPKAMGTLILSGMVLCVVDVYWVFKLRGTEWGAAFAAGAATWAAIGYGLLDLKESW